jgi:selenocysteine lyase/cysteine desulfurase
MRWANQLKDVPRIKIYSSLEPGQSWGIGYIGIDGVEARDLNDFLWNKYRIIGQAMTGGPYPAQQFDYRGTRITPNVYTTLEEIDTFVAAMKDAARNGVKA